MIKQHHYSASNIHKLLHPSSSTIDDEQNAWIFQGGYPLGLKVIRLWGDNIFGQSHKVLWAQVGLKGLNPNEDRT